MANVVDLRSDTVTRPTAAMRRAMADAEVGDDGWGEDPTVNQLEATFADRLGKEAAVFVPTGIMGNQIALRLLGRPGTRVLAGRHQHIVAYEHGAAALNAPIQFDLLDDTDGRLDAAAAEAAVADGNVPVSAVFIENTHMEASGAPWPLDAVDAIASLGLPVHMDGARLFNATVATGISPHDYAARATTVMCCLSKGLGAPVGSLLAGSADLIDQAREERKRLGGAMRQAGILAAAGLVALRDHVDRLAEDHARARRLAVAVAARYPGSLDPATVQTNIVVFPHAKPAPFCAHLAAEGVQAVPLGPGKVRFVTHLDVDDEGIARATRAIATAP
jgi:threonine aldolase